MDIPEYKSALKKILELTKTIETICQEGRYNDIAEPFSERDELFNQIMRENFDLDDEDLKFVKKITNQIQLKNELITELLKSKQVEIALHLKELNTETKIINAYKIPNEEQNHRFVDKKR